MHNTPNKPNRRPRLAATTLGVGLALYLVSALLPTPSQAACNPPGGEWCEMPAVDIDGPNALCITQTKTFTANPSSGEGICEGEFTYLWSGETGNATDLASSSLVTSYDDPGEKTVSVTVFLAGTGECWSTATKKFTVVKVEIIAGTEPTVNQTHPDGENTRIVKAKVTPEGRNLIATTADRPDTVDFHLTNPNEWTVRYKSGQHMQGTKEDNFIITIKDQEADCGVSTPGKALNTFRPGTTNYDNNQKCAKDTWREDWPGSWGGSGGLLTPDVRNSIVKYQSGGDQFKAGYKMVRRGSGKCSAKASVKMVPGVPPNGQGRAEAFIAIAAQSDDETARARAGAVAASSNKTEEQQLQVGFEAVIKAVTIVGNYTRTWKKLADDEAGPTYDAFVSSKTYEGEHSAGDLLELDTWHGVKVEINVHGANNGWRVRGEVNGETELDKEPAILWKSLY
jgi:hypothetical protein